MIVLIRKIRAENNIPVEKKIKIIIKTVDKDIINFCNNYQKDILFLVKGEELQIGENVLKPEGSSIGANEECEVYIPLHGVVDKQKEIERLTKEYNKIKIDYDKTNSKLNNETFLQKAPKDVIEKEKNKLKEFESVMKKIEENLKMLMN